MDKPTLEEIKQEDMENDLRDSLEWNEYTKTIEYENEQKQEELVDAIYKYHIKRVRLIIKLQDKESDYMQYLYKHKPSQELKQDILEIQEQIEQINDYTYELLEELEKI